MNIKRLFLAIVIGFVLLWVTDFLIHGVWMTVDYRATQQLWRPESEMGSYMLCMLGAQLLTVITFVLVWAKGFASATAKLIRDRPMRSLGHRDFFRLQTEFIRPEGFILSQINVMGWTSETR